MLVNLLRREKRGLSFMETALVTGGSGLIGKHIVSGLLKKGYAVISVDKEDDGDYFNVVGLPISSVMRRLKDF